MGIAEERADNSPLQERQGTKPASGSSKNTRQLLEAGGLRWNDDRICRAPRRGVRSDYLRSVPFQNEHLSELLNQGTFGTGYEQTVRQAMEEKNPEARLRGAARIVRQIHDSEWSSSICCAALMVAPEPAKLEEDCERIRYKRGKDMILSLHLDKYQFATMSRRKSLGLS